MADQSTDYASNAEIERVRIEEKLTFLDHTIGELNQVVFSQQKQIDRLAKQVDVITQHLRSLESEDPEPDPPEPPPPHY